MKMILPYRKTKRALKAKLENRGAHSQIFKYCREELTDENYFHAILEAIKGAAERIREMSGLSTDRAGLIQKAFSVKIPILKINSLITETEISKQKRFSNMLIGIFGSVRNPVAHAPKSSWPMTEQDALDIISTISFVHRKLDSASRL